MTILLIVVGLIPIVFGTCLVFDASGDFGDLAFGLVFIFSGVFLFSAGIADVIDWTARERISVSYLQYEQNPECVKWYREHSDINAEAVILRFDYKGE